MSDPEHAFVEQFELAPTGEGVLSGLTFGVKDLIDVEGRVTGCGNPVWARTHPPAAAHAPCLATLLAAGARCVGKTHTDELAYSLMGVNAHYGAPTNPAAPDRAPGGSSSGSVVSVAAGRVDFAIGTDTGGSVRLPASFCGVYGLRTSHGLVDKTGMAPLAPSFDVIGWFARTPELIGRVAEAFAFPPAAEATALAAPSDLWALAEPETTAALQPSLAALEALLGPADRAPFRGEGSDNADFRDVFRIVQAHEAWASVGDWIEANEPDFGPGVKERFALGKSIAEEAAAQAVLALEQIKSALAAMLPPGLVLVIPTVPSPAPLLKTEEASLDAFRTRALALLCFGGLGGLPQLSIPAGLVDGAPVGLSLVGGPGSDLALVDLASQLTAA